MSLSALFYRGVYRGLSGVLSPALPLLLEARARRGKEDRGRMGEKLGRYTVPRPDGHLVWLHGASVGESVSALPLIARLRDARPDLTVLVTTGTTTSAAIMAKRLADGALHQFAPLDSPDAVARFFDHWRPDAGLIMESELWPNLLMTARTRNIPLALVNARMSEKSFRGWQRSGAARDLLAAFTVCLAQDGLTADRLKSLGAACVAVPGNLKFEADPLPADPGALALLHSLTAGRPLWLAASTHPGEETRIADIHRAVRTEHPGLLTVLVPRHPDRGAALASVLAAPDLSVARRASETGQAGLPHPGTDLYIADTMGELGVFYRLADLVLIGGTLVPHGGQNPLEPARLDCAILYGPHIANFRDVFAALAAAAGAQAVLTDDDAAALVARLLSDRTARERLAANARALLERSQGVTDRVLAAVLPLIPAAAPATADV